MFFIVCILFDFRNGVVFYQVHLWNVNVVRAKHGLTPVTPNMVSDGFLEIEIDKYTIVDLAFSPDGSTVALACSDGGIRFFQV